LGADLKASFNEASSNNNFISTYGLILEIKREFVRSGRVWQV